MGQARRPPVGRHGTLAVQGPGGGRGSTLASQAVRSTSSSVRQAGLLLLAVSSFGYVLAKRWSAEVDVLASTAWQLLGGGLLLLPFAVAFAFAFAFAFEGSPPTLDAPELLGFAHVAIVATAVAFAAWFAGLRRLPAATVGLLGLLNPVTGVLLGTAIAGETLTLRQICGLMPTLTGILLGRRGGFLTARDGRNSACSN